MAFTLTKKLSSSLPLRTGRNYAVVLCNDSRLNLLVLFWTMCNFVKGLCDIKSLKILTAYDVWFSRYQPTNMKLATDSVLVIVFINFLWAVYIKILQKLTDNIRSTRYSLSAFGSSGSLFYSNATFQCREISTVKISLIFVMEILILIQITFVYWKVPSHINIHLWYAPIYAV